MIQVDWITNIPTPYRNHLYQGIDEIFPEHGLSVTVHYMAETEPDRYWNLAAEDLTHRCEVHKGFSPRIAGTDLHFSPKLLNTIRRRRSPVLVVGGYSSPTHFLAPFLAHGARLRLLYSETHLASERRTGRVVRFLKRTSVRSFDGFIVPGPLQRQFILRLSAAASGKTFLTLPNLIDDSVYGEGVRTWRRKRAQLRTDLKVTPHHQLWLCPARLEPFKGLQEFVRALPRKPEYVLLIAGDGSLREALERQAFDLGVDVRLLGNLSQEEMTKLYAAADLFVLPSLQDPSPLSPIEACAASLPLLVSDRIGNLAEVLHPDENGWSFDPRNSAELAKLLRHILKTSREQLRARGQLSRKIYRRNFDSKSTITNLAESVRRLYSRLASPRPVHP